MTDGVELTYRAANSVTEIHDSAGRVTQAIGDITRILSEQSASVQEMAGRVHQIADSSVENRDIAICNSQSSDELAELARKLQQVVTGFKIA